MMEEEKIKVLFVCMGNICRSPAAEGSFTKAVVNANLSDSIEIDSAGTHAYHVGEQPDARAEKSALARGIDISHLKARRAIEEDFDRFDYVLAMDYDNYRGLEKICPLGMEHKLQLFLSYAPHLNMSDVPDPYYGGALGFETVLDLVEAASEGLLDFIKDKHDL
jgi:protein-tyrosine phosphatase